MNIEEIIAKFKQEGKTDEEIRAEFERIKKDIDAFLGDDEGKEKDAEVKTEVKEDEKEDEERMRKVFGI